MFGSISEQVCVLGGSQCFEGGVLECHYINVLLYCMINVDSTRVAQWPISQGARAVMRTVQFEVVVV